MTDTENLLTMIARLYELAQFYAPQFAQRDLTSCYADILELVGAISEAQRIAPAPGQIGFWDVEAWPI